MSDFREISELPPAPRRTPTWALWVMGAVVVGGSATLLGAEAADDGTSASTAADAPTRHATAVAAAPSSDPTGTETRK